MRKENLLNNHHKFLSLFDRIGYLVTYGSNQSDHLTVYIYRDFYFYTLSADLSPDLLVVNRSNIKLVE